jgi:hypothetical protein
MLVLQAVLIMKMQQFGKLKNNGWMELFVKWDFLMAVKVFVLLGVVDADVLIVNKKLRI